MWIKYGQDVDVTVMGADEFFIALCFVSSVVKSEHDWSINYIFYSPPLFTW